MPTESKPLDEIESLADKVPAHTLFSLRRYAIDHHPTGGFLRAVLDNKLFEAVGRADLENQRTLCDICVYIYNCLPQDCWGSPEKVTEWLRERSDN